MDVPDAPLADELGPPEVSTDTYALGAEIGRGGMGRVLSARDRRTGRAVALKEVLATDPVTLERFQREARLTTQLQHPGIVSIYEVGRWPDGRPFYAMPILAGRTLREAIAGSGSATERLHLVPAVLAAADAVAYAHDRGVIHRDLTPSNIVLGSFGETIVIDWGVAKDLNEEGSAGGAGEAGGGPRSAGGLGLTAAGSVIGTPAYISPEQAEGRRVDERTDVYALGAILYQVLTGRPPYGSAGPETAVAKLRGLEPPSFVADKAIPKDLMSIARKAMALDAGQRYLTAQAMGEDLRRYQRGERVRAHVYSRRELAGRWLARRLRLVIAGSLTLLLASAGAAVAGVKMTRLRRRADDAATELVKIRRELVTPAPPRNGHPREPIRGWFAGGSNPDEYEMGLDQAVRWRGRPSAYVRKKPLDTGGHALLMQSFAADAYLGKRLRFSAYVKSSSRESWGGLWMRADPPGQRGSELDNMQHLSFKEMNDWRRFDVVVDVPGDAGEVSLGILVGKEGTVWMNGLELEIVDQKVPLTGAVDDRGAEYPRNLDFNEPSRGSFAAPEGWGWVADRPGDYEVSVDRTNLHRGQPTAFLKSKLYKNNGYALLLQAVGAAGYRGKRLRFSAQVQATDVSGWAALWMVVEGRSRVVLASDNMADRPITGTSSWVNYQVVLDVPAEAREIVFGAQLYGAGAISLSDVKLGVVDGSVAVTSKEALRRPANLELSR